MVGDYVGWGISIIAIIIAIYYGRQNKNLKNSSQQVHNKAEKIVQHNYYINAPSEVKNDLDFIVSNSGGVSNITQVKSYRVKG